VPVKIQPLDIVPSLNTSLDHPNISTCWERK